VTVPGSFGGRLEALVAEHARGSSLDAGAPTWQDLGIDSLGLVSFVVACEDELGVEVPDRVLSRLRGPVELGAWLDERYGTV
jgi:acyl carrier protein